MMPYTKAIAQSNNFIVLDQYPKEWQVGEPCQHHQSEKELELELIADLVRQGYEYRKDIRSQKAMLANVRQQLQRLNEVEFSDAEWQRFVETYLDKANDGIVEKSDKIHNNSVHDFSFDDDGSTNNTQKIKNIRLLDKKNICRNKLQVINQLKQTGTHTNQYDVTILVNGLPLVHIELKKRGTNIREAFNQTHRYSKESFNSTNSLFKFIQIFIISNGTDSLYFANTTKRDKNSFNFTMNWAKADNNLLPDLKDFTATFLQKNTLLKVLIDYCVFDTDNTLLVMRPYQIAATERILWKIHSSYTAKNWSNTESGGYIWHATGSGKTLTSFKTARMVTELDFIDKVLFVVDRKDLDAHTMREYESYSKESVSGSASTKILKENLYEADNKIVVTTLQKLHSLMKSEDNLPVYHKQVVFIFDECHRSQFGQAQKQLRKKFKRYYQFGFTGTPIFKDNASGSETTAGTFGREIHSYILTDAIRHDKVLKFKVDYNDVRPKFRDMESELDLDKLSALEHKQALLHPQRIREISQYILDHYRHKTHRLQGNNQGFNAMFAVSSIEAAKLYYETLNELQKESKKPLKIATIFSFNANEEQSAIGEIADESFDVSAMNSSAKEFLSRTINDYNHYFKSNFGVDSKGFEAYYKDLAKQVKAKKIDLMIVVGMFLTGFDAPTLNTLFVDKNLRYHGLIQAYSRTNRIYDSTKAFGNIVTFRDLEQATIDAIVLFGNENTRSVILEKSYHEYMQGFKDDSGEIKRGFNEVVAELQQRFPNATEIIREADKKAFVKLFGEYLRLENILQNYDEFVAVKALQQIDRNNQEAVESFKIKHHLNDTDFAEISQVNLPTERQIQDYRSTYNDIREWIQHEKIANETEQFTVDWDDVVFEVDLLKSQEINLDYILEQIFEHNKQAGDKVALMNDIRRIIKASVDNRAKEGLVLDFIEQTDLDALGGKTSTIEAFFHFAEAQQRHEAAELIRAETLNPEAAKRYMTLSIKQGFASDHGTDLHDILPAISPLNPEYPPKRQRVFDKISTFVEKFKGVGGKI